MSGVFLPGRVIRREGYSLFPAKKTIMAMEKSTFLGRKGLVSTETALSSFTMNRSFSVGERILGLGLLRGLKKITMCLALSRLHHHLLALSRSPSTNFLALSRFIIQFSGLSRPPSFNSGFVSPSITTFSY
ncbi:hypothetical protein AVEN_36823-1 [Araneus ventricosus]|uniref:Uncharacterized protein n=1 Tax=Araneus ventricosus TaxID=182803 RepID=A0A4Y2S6V4_ARAVE|nr:hypothetical protein AVEN_36823-1 [Araneus ventricosus]